MSLPKLFLLSLFACLFQNAYSGLDLEIEQIGSLLDSEPYRLEFEDPAFDRNYNTPGENLIYGTDPFELGFGEVRIVTGETNTRLLGAADMIGDFPFLRDHFTVTAVQQSIAAGNGVILSNARGLDSDQNDETNFVLTLHRQFQPRGPYAMTHYLDGTDPKFGNEPVRFMVVDVPIEPEFIRVPRGLLPPVFFVVYTAPQEPEDAPFDRAYIIGFNPNSPDDIVCAAIDPGILPPASIFPNNEIIGEGKSSAWDFSTQGRFLALLNELEFVVPLNDDNNVYTGRFSADPETVLFRYTMSLIYDIPTEVPDEENEEPLPIPETGFMFKYGTQTAVENTAMVGFNGEDSPSTIPITTIFEFEKTSGGESFFVFQSPDLNSQIDFPRPTLGRLSDAVRIANPTPGVDLTKGDINDDGNVDRLDAIPFWSFFTEQGVEPIGSRFEEADIDSDGDVDHIDLDLLRPVIAISEDAEKQSTKGIDGDQDFVNPGYGFAIVEHASPIPQFPGYNHFNPHEIRVLEDGSAMVFIGRATMGFDFQNQFQILWYWTPENGLEPLLNTRDDTFGIGPVKTLGFKRLSNINGLNQVALVVEFESDQFGIFKFQVAQQPDLPDPLMAEDNSWQLY